MGWDPLGDNLSRKKHLKFDSSFGLTCFFGGKLVLLEQSPKSSEGPLGLTRNSVCLLRDIGISGQGPDMIRSDFLKTIFIYFFGCAGSRYGVPTLCCTLRDLVPRPGIDPGPPALGAWHRSHWTTREVPRLDFWAVRSLGCGRDVLVGVHFPGSCFPSTRGERAAHSRCVCRWLNTVKRLYWNQWSQRFTVLLGERSEIVDGKCLAHSTRPQLASGV